jgi:hypothetical protein
MLFFRDYTHYTECWRILASDMLGKSNQRWHSIGKRICGAEYRESGLKRWNQRSLAFV